MAAGFRKIVGSMGNMSPMDRLQRFQEMRRAAPMGPNAGVTPMPGRPAPVDQPVIPMPGGAAPVNQIPVTRRFAKGGEVKKAKGGGMMCSPRKKMAMGGMVKGCKRSGVK